MGGLRGALVAAGIGALGLGVSRHWSQGADRQPLAHPALAVALALAAYGATRLAGRACRHPALLATGCAIVLHAGYGAEFRGSTRWLSLPGIGLVSLCEIVLALACLALTRDARVIVRGLSGLACAAFLVCVNAKTYAAMTVTITLLSIGTLRSPRAAFAGATALALSIALGLNFTAAGSRLRDFLTDSGASGYTAARLDRFAVQAPWLPRNPDGQPPWSGPFVFDDFTLLWDAWHLGWIATAVLWALTYAGLVLAVRRCRPNRLRNLLTTCIGIKLALHLCSTLQLTPVMGVGAPLLTWSKTEWIAAGLLLGQASVDEAPAAAPAAAPAPGPTARSRAGRC